MVLDPYREQIKEYHQLGLSLSHIRTIVDPQLEKPYQLSFLTIFLSVKMRSCLSCGRSKKK
jgi:hypothetical protein